MAVKLTIRDGNPHWWLSPDIWVVPGADPDGPPGQPIAGQPAYLWARITNSGATDANGARIDFFWANPALQVLRSTATSIGSAFADIPAGSTQDALCLVPWIPVIVNDGHECVVAVANHPGDSLPTPLPDAFSPPSYDQVAQLNLEVLSASSAMMFKRLTVAAPKRRDKLSKIRLDTTGELDRATLKSLGLGNLKPAQRADVKASLHKEPRRDESSDHDGRRELEMKIAGGTQASVYVSLAVSGLRNGEYQLVSVIEENEKQPVGGYTFVVISGEGGGK